MKNILIANTKGGSGKTTLATNLAGYLANGQGRVALQDLDRQQSSTQWLARRPNHLPDIAVAGSQLDEFDWVVTDSPAGFRNEKLDQAIKLADCVLVPIQPSPFDIGAAHDFLTILANEKAIRKNKTFVGLVGSRVNSRTNAAIKLADFMGESDFPVLAYLRHSQNYSTAAEEGISIFDLRPSIASQDWEQWSVLLDWVKQATA
jgi:chromosome partitioning protein